MLVITEAQRVASVAAVPVFRVTRADVVPIHVTNLTSPETVRDAFCRLFVQSVIVFSERMKRSTCVCSRRFCRAALSTFRMTTT